MSPDYYIDLLCAILHDVPLCIVARRPQSTSASWEARVSLQIDI